MAKQNLTPENRIFALEEKDSRRDIHYTNLNKKIDELTASQRQIIDLLAGSNLNGNKGLVKLLETVEEKVNLNREQIRDIQKDIDNVKFWGRGATGLLFACVLVIINFIKDKV
jgi:DNA-directed RNA polymerase sigma subunit (sigma70/sigma32)